MRVVIQSSGNRGAGRRAGRWQSLAAILVVLPTTVGAPATAALPPSVDPPERPKTALVLSGGGARGFAHIGVLKVLEKQRVPVDLVVGTSIGAIAGGLYASGFSPAELEATFASTDWVDLFSDRPPRKHISFRRKQDDDEPLFGFELGVGRDGLSLPSGLVAGQKLNFLLRTKTIGTTGLERFDDLAIPFRAVATDLTTGELVVLGDGDLAMALRASMAVPGAFTPVERDGRTLVDGGLVRNLPVDVARELGAERVIAVNVSARLDDLDRGSSAFGVAVRSFDVLTDRNVQEQLALIGEEDLLISPELESVRSAAFGSARDAVVLGEAAAQAQADALAAFAVPEDEFAVFLKTQRQARRRTLTGTHVDRIEIRGASRVSPEIMRRRIRSRAGEDLDLSTLRSDLDRIYQIGEFEEVDFRLVREAGDQVLEIHARDKDWGPHYLRLGMSLEANFEGQGDFTALANHRRSQINRLGAEWKNLVRIGDTDSIFSEFFQPLDYAGFSFVAPAGSCSRGNQGKFQDAAGEVFRGRQPDRDGALGLRRAVPQLRGDSNRVSTWDRPTPTSSPPPVWRRCGAKSAGGPRGSPSISSTTRIFRGRARSRRSICSCRGRRPVADDTYDRLSFEGIHAASFGRHTIAARVLYGTNLGTTIPFYDEFTLGGFLRLSGLEPGQLQGDILGHGSLIYYRELGRLPGALGGGVYIGGSLEAGNVWPSIEEAELGDLRPAAMVFGGMDTVLGPLYLGYGRADGGDSSFYLFVGRLF